MKVQKLFIIFLLLLTGADFINAQKQMSISQGSYKWNSQKTSTTIPFILIKNLVVITTEINKVKVNLVLDTGMPIMGGANNK